MRLQVTKLSLIFTSLRRNNEPQRKAPMVILFSSEYEMYHLTWELGVGVACQPYSAQKEEGTKSYV